MATSIVQLVVEFALLFMKVIGVSAQKRKNLLDWANRKMQEASGSVQMKKDWEKMYKKLSDKLDKNAKKVKSIKQKQG
jgi:hypothetical protein